MFRHTRFSISLKVDCRGCCRDLSYCAFATHFAMASPLVSGEVVMVSFSSEVDNALSDKWQGIEWMLFFCAYTLVAMRIGVRLAHQQQKHIIISDVFLIISALNLLGLIICELKHGYAETH